MKNNYKLLKNDDNKYNVINCDAKYLLKNNPRLSIVTNNNEIYKCDNIQSLYLYPLTVIDYINNLTNKNIIFLNIIEIDLNLNYAKLFEDKKFCSLKAIEILIKSDYSSNYYKKIIEILEIMHNRGIAISLNIKNLSTISELLKNYLKRIIYFKIFLPTEFDEEYYNTFLDKLSFIKKTSSSNSLVHIKTYLDLKQVMFYEKMVNDFSKLNVDIFQVSKQLIEINGENIKVNEDVQKIIRNLELKYSSYNNCKFISVKDINFLYYPRFELDERNSKRCYACYMKPYLFKNKILPCKVNKIFLNLNDWSVNYLDNDKFNNIMDKCGIYCDDCASIFENDLLNDVENIINNNENVCIFLKKD